MRSKLVAVVFVLIAGSTSEVHAAGLLNKHNNQNIDATKGTGNWVVYHLEYMISKRTKGR